MNIKCPKCGYELAGIERYIVKRQAGIPAIRKDGSIPSLENDEQSYRAEEYCANLLGVPFNKSIYIHGDGGKDFIYKGRNCEVIWLGFVKGTDIPRISGHLIVNPNEINRLAEIYIVISGSIKNNFDFVGWTWHQNLITEPQKDYGFGKTYSMSTYKLFDLQTLRDLK